MKVIANIFLLWSLLSLFNLQKNRQEESCRHHSPFICDKGFPPRLCFAFLQLLLMAPWHSHSCLALPFKGVHLPRLWLLQLQIFLPNCSFKPFLDGPWDPQGVTDSGCTWSLWSGAAASFEESLSHCQVLHMQMIPATGTLPSVQERAGDTAGGAQQCSQALGKAQAQGWPCLTPCIPPGPSVPSWLCQAEERAQSPCCRLCQAPGTQQNNTGLHPSVHPSIPAPIASSSGHCPCSPLCTALITLITLCSTPTQPELEVTLSQFSKDRSINANTEMKTVVRALLGEPLGQKEWKGMKRIPEPVTHDTPTTTWHPSCH